LICPSVFSAGQWVECLLLVLQLRPFWEFIGEAGHNVNKEIETALDNLRASWQSGSHDVETVRGVGRKGQGKGAGQGWNVQGRAQGGASQMDKAKAKRASKHSANRFGLVHFDENILGQ
jgi:hypothetical protein